MALIPTTAIPTAVHPATAIPMILTMISILRFRIRAMETIPILTAPAAHPAAVLPAVAMILHGHRTM